MVVYMHACLIFIPSLSSNVALPQISSLVQLESTLAQCRVIVVMQCMVSSRTICEVSLGNEVLYTGIKTQTQSCIIVISLLLYIAWFFSKMKSCMHAPLI